ncbi:phage tail tube protein [Clostridium senegalense]
MAKNVNDILRGNDGKVWINGEEIINAKSIKATATPKFDNQEFIGDNGTYQSYAGWEGKGSLKLIKTKSVGLNYLGDSLKTGVFPEIIIESKIENKQTGKAERIVLYGVLFTELTLIDLEAKKSIEEELSFTFTDYDIKDTI